MTAVMTRVLHLGIRSFAVATLASKSHASCSLVALWMWKCSSNGKLLQTPFSLGALFAFALWVVLPSSPWPRHLWIRARFITVLRSEGLCCSGDILVRHRVVDCMGSLDSSCMGLLAYLLGRAGSRSRPFSHTNLSQEDPLEAFSFHSAPGKVKPSARVQLHASQSSSQHDAEDVGCAPPAAQRTLAPCPKAKCSNDRRRSHGS
jgi:hypothetical protein